MKKGDGSTWRVAHAPHRKPPPMVGALAAKGEQQEQHLHDEGAHEGQKELAPRSDATRADA